MSKKENPDFYIKCEGDVERVCQVFTGWLRTNDVNFDKLYRVRVPNEYWAHIFVDIYADYISNEGLEEEAEANIINIVFEVEEVHMNPEEFNKLKDMTDEELLDALEDFMDNMDDDDDEDDTND
jgi:hypothetical protein